MPACEKCWEQASAVAARSGLSVIEAYYELLKQNEGKDGHD